TFSMSTTSRRLPSSMRPAIFSCMLGTCSPWKGPDKNSHTASFRPSMVMSSASDLIRQPFRKGDAPELQPADERPHAAAFERDRRGEHDGDCLGLARID